jgi:uncharacterized SAM-binding protein YcdF (DUF218 family)
VISRIIRFVLAFLAPAALPFLLGIGAWIAGRRGWLKVRTSLLVIAVAMAYLVAIVPVGDELLWPLESAYPPLRDDDLPRVCCIVVLGSGYAPHDGVPATAALDQDGLVRVVEGLRLAKKLGSPTLVVSGGAPPGRGRPADGYARLARDFGIPGSPPVVLNEALNTAQEARAVTQLLGSKPFILVTSAAHMPRAMLLMKRAGAKPIPAPTGQLTGRPRGRDSWLPSAGGLGRTEQALHEYLGLVALWAHLAD